MQTTLNIFADNKIGTSFLKGDGTVINTQEDKLNQIFEPCCGHIKGHSSPTAIQSYCLCPRKPS